MINREQLLLKSKEIHIPIHGTVSMVWLMAKYFIDNKYFQRLHKLKQLGTCDFIYPSAKHTRFEHSLGTYYLAVSRQNYYKNKTYIKYNKCFDH